VIFGVADVTLGIGGMVGNYFFGVVASVTGAFVWVYISIAAAALVLGLLSIPLPAEGGTGEAPARKTAPDGGKLDAAEGVRPRAGETTPAPIPANSDGTKSLLWPSPLPADPARDRNGNAGSPRLSATGSPLRGGLNCVSSTARRRKTWTIPCRPLRELPRATRQACAMRSPAKKYRGVMVGIRRDEQATRAKERAFSPRAFVNSRKSAAIVVSPPHLGIVSLRNFQAGVGSIAA
jgi:hypothetical protein